MSFTLAVISDCVAPAVPTIISCGKAEFLCCQITSNYSLAISVIFHQQTSFWTHRGQEYDTCSFMLGISSAFSLLLWKINTVYASNSRTETYDQMRTRPATKYKSYFWLCYFPFNFMQVSKLKRETNSKECSKNIKCCKCCRTTIFQMQMLSFYILQIGFNLVWE